MAKIIDLTGQRFGRLVVLQKSAQKSKNGSAMWECRCDCGNKVAVSAKHLKSGATKSCGCLRKELACQKGKTLFNKTNRYDLSGEYGVGFDNNNEEFYFDLDDYEKIKQYSWYISSNGYVIAYDNVNSYVSMHCLVCNAINIDHKNGNKRDNRKQNLRQPKGIYSFNTYNNMNRSLNKNNTSGTSGVYYDKNSNKWVSRIGLNHKRINLGLFKTKIEAVEARKNAEERYYGEYSYSNSREGEEWKN